MHATFTAPTGLGGAITPPPDKSLTHRALLLGAMAEGVTHVTNPLATGDCLSTQACLKALGVRIETLSPGEPRTLVVQGVGLRGFREPEDVLDAENSGTTTRLLSGVLAGQKLQAVLTGDASLRSRPMLRVVHPLRAMGARIEGRGDGRYAPLVFLPGVGTLRGGTHVLEVASAQVKSALLLAGLRAEGEVRLRGLLRSRDHTERFFRFLGIPLTVADEEIVLPAGSRPRPFRALIPGDPSSAAFFLAAAVLSGRDLVVRDCCLNPTRLGFVRVLERMGAAITVSPESEACGEPVGRITVRPADLVAAEVGPDEVPGLIDEVPLLALVACAARGVTRIRGADELRHKETDRLRGIADLLGRLGARVSVLDDGLEIEGPQRLRGGTVRSLGDHRLAMTGAVAATVAREAVVVEEVEAYRVSYTDFLAHYAGLGGRVETAAVSP